MTPLDYAEWKGNDQAVALLRQSGAKRRAEITDMTKSFQAALNIA
jgi:ankyrin repeat protein